MLSDHQAKSYFLESSVTTQLQNMFKKGEFSSLLSHRFNKVCIDDLCSRRGLTSSVTTVAERVDIQRHVSIKIMLIMLEGNMAHP